MTAQQTSRWRRMAVVVLVQPPFVPRVLWPRTVAEAALQRLPDVLDNLLNRIDLTQLVIDRISVPRIVDAIDIDAVLARIDFSGIVAKVVDDIDLPDLIRDSTEAVASDAVVGVRLQSAFADDTVDRWAARLQPLRRRVQERAGIEE